MWRGVCGTLVKRRFISVKLSYDQTVSRMELGVIKLWACCEVLKSGLVTCDGIWIFIGSMPSSTEGREGLREELFFFTHPCQGPNDRSFESRISGRRPILEAAYPVLLRCSSHETPFYSSSP